MIKVKTKINIRKMHSMYVLFSKLLKIETRGCLNNFITFSQQYFYLHWIYKRQIN